MPILSYDAAAPRRVRRPRRSRYLTGDYRKEYDKLFDGVSPQNAPSTGTVVEAELVSSGVVRAGDDRVQVFLLVDQTRTNKAEQRAGGLQELGHGDDGAGRRRLAGRRPRHLSRAAHRAARCLTWPPREFMIVANAAPGLSSLRPGFVAAACVR